jgi:predicted Rdx family selenoprotein
MNPTIVPDGYIQTLSASGVAIPESPQPISDPTLPMVVKKEELAEEIGQSGTLVFGGFINGEEYNTDLIGRAGLQIYEEMRKSDAAVGATLKLLKLPIRSAKFFVEPASEDAQDVKVAEFIEDALMNQIDWQLTLSEMLTFLEFGHYVGELVFMPKVFQGSTVITLKKIAFRKQTTILKWTQADGQPGITQVTGTGGVFSIPADKLMVLTNEREGNNYAGVSVLRPAYKHYYIKDQLYKISAIAHERQGLGVVYIQPPDNADEGDRGKAIEAAQNIRANENAYIEVPKNWIIEFMDMKGHTTIDPEKDISHHNRMIWTNILGQFMEMGSHKGSGGTQSSSQDQSKYLDMNLESIANNICDVLQRQVIRKLVDINFNVKEYPILKHSALNETDISKITTAMAILANANLLTPTADTEKTTREMLNLPDLDEEYEEDYNSRPKNTPTTLDAKQALDAATANASNGNPPSADDVAEVKKAAESALEATDRMIKFYER